MCSRESQDQSIKARKHELFEDEKNGSQQGSLKAFSQYLEETPAAPLSTRLWRSIPIRRPPSLCGASC